LSKGDIIKINQSLCEGTRQTLLMVLWVELSW